MTFLSFDEAVTTIRTMELPNLPRNKNSLWNYTEENWNGMRFIENKKGEKGIDKDSMIRAALRGDYWGPTNRMNELLKEAMLLEEKATLVKKQLEANGWSVDPDDDEDQ